MKTRKKSILFILFLLSAAAGLCACVSGALSVKDTPQVQSVAFEENAFIETLCAHTRAMDSQFIVNFSPSETLSADIERAVERAQATRFDCAYNMDSIIWNMMEYEDYTCANFKIIYDMQLPPRPQVLHAADVDWAETLERLAASLQSEYRVCIPADERAASAIVADLQAASAQVDQALFSYLVKGNELSVLEYEDYTVLTLILRYRESVVAPDALYNAEDSYAAALHLMDVLEDGAEKITLRVPASISRETLQLLLWTAQINDSADMVEEALTGVGNYFEARDGSYIAELSILYSGTEAERERCRMELKAALQGVEDEIRADMPDSGEDLYRAIADAIAKRAEYDREMSEASVEETLTDEMRFLRTAYGALCDGRSVCTSYAAAFKALCDRFSLPCWVMMGYYEDMGHAWNCVLLDGELRFVDPTFYDTARDRSSLLFTAEQYERRPYILENNYTVPPWYSLEVPQGEAMAGLHEKAA